MATGVKFIERKRREYVDHEATKLFNGIVAATVAMTPSNRYELDVEWDRRVEVIDTLILKRVADMFRELGSDLDVQRRNETSVKAILTTEAKLEEEVVLTLHWSRAPGKFVNKNTGAAVTLAANLNIGPVFTGTVREWYETLVETLIDCGNQMRQKFDLAPSILYVGPDVKTILECSVLYRPNFSLESAIAHSDAHEGTLSNRFKVYADSGLKDTVRLVLVKDNKRIVGEVKILDMNII